MSTRTVSSVSRKSKNSKTPKKRHIKVYGPYGSSIKVPVPVLPWLKVGSDTKLYSKATVNPDRVTFCLPIVPAQVALAAGVMSTTLPITLGMFNNSAALIALFEEYCIVGASFEFRMNPTAAFDTGFFAIAADMADNTPPTSTILSSPHLEMMCTTNAAMNKEYLDYLPASPLALEWTPTSSTVDFAWLKFYASLANTFTTAAMTSKLLMTGTISVSFRQFKQ